MTRVRIIISKRILSSAAHVRKTCHPSVWEVRSRLKGGVGVRGPTCNGWIHEVYCLALDNTVSNARVKARPSQISSARKPGRAMVMSS